MSKSAKFALVIYPLGFREGKVKPEVLAVYDLDHIQDVNDFARFYTLSRFNGPEEFEGCHVVPIT